MTDSVSYSREKGAFAPPPEPIEKPAGIRRIIAVLSGKGGVGKSTISANLAISLAKRGAKVGLLDADLAGHSQSILLATNTSHEKIRQGEPAECFGVRVASLGFLYPDADTVIWRGPMISKGIKSLLTQTKWGELDYLIIDLPPGTSDAQLTALRDIPTSSGIVVSTPQRIAVTIAERGIKMLLELQKPVLGVIENMSATVCPHCGQPLTIFDSGSGKALAAKYDISFLGEIPLDAEIRKASDAGKPYVVMQPDSTITKIFERIAEKILQKLP